jgi:RNA polymerase sigma factor (sigma-70 family)
MPASAPDPSKQETDFWLRLRDADEATLAAIVQEYEVEIRRAATMRIGPLLRPHLDSVDLVQSVYITLLKGLRGEKFHIAGPQELVALSAEIIRRKVAQVWKRLKRRTELNTNLTGTREDDEHVIVNRDGEPDPMADAEMRDAIERIMQECDPADKKLLQLRLEGNSTAEAARALDADPDVLRVRLSRLRKRLTERGLLAEWL